MIEETEEEAKERQFAGLCRLAYKAIAADRPWPRSMREIGRTLFGFTNEECDRIRARAAHKVWKGISSDEMIERIKERDSRQAA